MSVKGINWVSTMSSFQNQNNRDNNKNHNKNHHKNHSIQTGDEACSCSADKHTDMLIIAKFTWAVNSEPVSSGSRIPSVRCREKNREIQSSMGSL